jgi:hypothetical protein
MHIVDGCENAEQLSFWSRQCPKINSVFGVGGIRLQVLVANNVLPVVKHRKIVSDSC